MEPHTGIEPVALSWKHSMLPIHQCGIGRRSVSRTRSISSTQKRRDPVSLISDYNYSGGPCRLCSDSNGVTSHRATITPMDRMVWLAGLEPATVSRHLSAPSGAFSQLNYSQMFIVTHVNSEFPAGLEPACILRCLTDLQSVA